MTMKTYRVADLNNGPFGCAYSTVEAALAARLEYVEEGFLANREEMDDEAAMAAAQDFFRIVDADTGEEVAA